MALTGAPLNSCCRLVRVQWAGALQTSVPQWVNVSRAVAGMYSVIMYARDSVASLVADLGLGPSVHRLGPRPWTEVLDLMDSADCFVFSSLRDSFGGRCLEAAARGLPLAVLNHHGAGELCRTPLPARLALMSRPGGPPRGRDDRRRQRPGPVAGHEPVRHGMGRAADLGGQGRRGAADPRTAGRPGEPTQRWL